MNISEIRSRLDSAEARKVVGAYEARCGKLGERESRVIPLADVEVRDSGNPNVEFTVQGHAAVFGRKSLDLGYFTEVIDRGAFDKVLDSAPDVHLLWDHDTRLALARTKSATYTLELRDDPKGLRFYSKVAPTSFAADLRILMEGGVIDQASFAFTVESDTWEIHDDGKGNETVVRTIHEVRALYDVTICAQGAYPQTDSSVARDYALAYAHDTGRFEERVTDDEAQADSEVPSEPVEAISDDSATDDADKADSTGDATVTDATAGDGEGSETEGEAEEDAATDTEGDRPDSDSADADDAAPTSNRALRLAQARLGARVAAFKSELEELS